jgi:hypothetical protein
MQTSLESILQCDPESRIWLDEPESALAHSTKELTKVELLNGGINIAATAATAALTVNPFLLTASGMVCEKLGPAVWEAYKAHRDGQPLLTQTHLQNVTANLTADLLGHDPAYAAFMLGLIASGTNPVVASGVSFLAAIPVAAAVQAGGGELLHRGLKTFSARQGFHWEDYYETRFLIPSEIEARRAFLDTSDHFGLQNDTLNVYEDTYYKHRVPAFGNRLGHARLRIVDGETRFQNAELSYTLARKRSPSSSEFHFFYVHKEKGRKSVAQRLPSMQRWLTEEQETITFQRRIRYNTDIRLVLDRILLPDNRELSLIELKAYTEDKQFFPAMRYMLRNHRSILTNYSKIRLVEECHANPAIE